MARYVIGLENVLNNIQREIMAVRGRTYKGMFAAMKYLENEMDNTIPLVPIDTKKMRDSWFIGGEAHPTNPIVFAGYTADYAPIVHENVGAVNWTRQGSGPKWLQIHFDRSRFQMLMIVAQNAKIPGTRTVGGLSSASNFVNIGDRTTERNVEF